MRPEPIGSVTNMLEVPTWSWGILALVWIVCTLIAAFKAYDGQAYRYPVTIRLFK